MSSFVTQASDPGISATCWTWAGDRSPLACTGRRVPSFEARLDALSAAGWSYFGLDIFDVRGAGASVDDLATAAHERGLECIEVEFLENWWVPAGPERAMADRDRDDLLAAAHAFGCEVVKIGPALEDDPSFTWAHQIAGLNRLAARGRDAGVRFAIEPMPFTPLPDLIAARKLLDEVDPAIGLCVDVCHVFRSGLPYDELAAVVDPDRLFRVELADGLRTPIGSLRDDTVDHRLLPGQGDFKVRDFAARLRELGWSGIWGVEILSAALRATPVEEALRAVREATLGVLTHDVIDGAPPQGRRA